MYNLNNYFFKKMITSNDNNDNYMVRDMNSFSEVLLKFFGLVPSGEVNHRTADIKLPDMQLWVSR